jgi:AcrR family transcriptional regulator
MHMPIDSGRQWLYVSVITKGWVMVVIGRPREFDREAALGAAMLVFWRKGFSAASMNDLCEAMGIRSPSLYAAFGSKEALYLEALEHYVGTVGPLIWGELAEPTSARSSVENLLLAAAEALAESDVTPAGCMATLAAVSDEWPAPIVEAVKEVRTIMLGRLRARLDAAIADRELPASANAEGLSRFYLAVYQGMAVQARDGATSAELKSVAETAMAAWPAA